MVILPESLEIIIELSIFGLILISLIYFPIYAILLFLIIVYYKRETLGIVTQKRDNKRRLKLTPIEYLTSILVFLTLSLIFLTAYPIIVTNNNPVYVIITMAVSLVIAVFFLLQLRERKEDEKDCQ